MVMNKRLKVVLIAFIILSIVKFFTAKVGLLGDPTVQLVVKAKPTISNSFMMTGEENQANREKYKGEWYSQGQYIAITGDEGGFSGESLYDLLIYTWWILLGGIPVYLLISKIRSLRKAGGI